MFIRWPRRAVCLLLVALAALILCECPHHVQAETDLVLDLSDGVGRVLVDGDVQDDVMVTTMHATPQHMFSHRRRETTMSFDACFDACGTCGNEGCQTCFQEVLQQCSSGCGSSSSCPGGWTESSSTSCGSGRTIVECQLANCEKCTGCKPGYINPPACDPDPEACNPACENGGTCEAGSCACPTNYFGDACDSFCEASVTCNGNGDCQNDGSCDCDNGFSGDDCRCTRNQWCSGHGTCTANGDCDCDTYFSGTRCDTCSNGYCNNHGTCSGGVCTCSGHWDGAYCSFCETGWVGSDCDVECSGGDCVHGTCNDGASIQAEMCDCDQGFTGQECDYCDTHYYPQGVQRSSSQGCRFCNDATNNCFAGSCNSNGFCSCEEGYTGSKCDRCATHYHPQSVTRPGSCTRCVAEEECHGNGACTTSGTCNCDPGFAGPDCDSCLAGYFGPNCEACDPVTDCSNHGTCDNDDGSCNCDPQWTGVDCSSCAPNHHGSNCVWCVEGTHCDGHGDCTNSGTCDCHDGYQGTNCTSCALDYHDRDGTCVYCTDGDTCNGNGNCDGQGYCQCDTGFQGAECQQCAQHYYDWPTCRRCRAWVECSSHGSCDENGFCVCDFGFTGAACDSCMTHHYGDDCIKCQAAVNCTGHGACVTNGFNAGDCDCNPQWEGGACDRCAPHHFTAACHFCKADLHCENRGDCNENTALCNCHIGFAGANCTACASDYYGSTCLSCPGRGTANGVCSNHGTCADGKAGNGECTCTGGHRGPNCQYHRNTTCSGHGDLVDEQGTCLCDTGFDGPSCSVCAENHYDYPTCVFCTRVDSCSDHGDCDDETGACNCDPGFDLLDCSACAPDDWYAYPVCRFCEQAETCSSNGVCNNDGFCDCFTGFEGTNCAECVSGYWGDTCNECLPWHGNPCQGRGSCNDRRAGDGKCACYPPYHGQECSHPVIDLITPVPIGTAGLEIGFLAGQLLNASGVVWYSDDLLTNTSIAPTSYDPDNVIFQLPSVAPLPASAMFSEDHIVIRVAAVTGLLSLPYYLEVRPPVVSLVTPFDYKTKGTTVATISGSYLGEYTAFGTNNKVFWDGVELPPGNFISWTHDTIEVLIPAGTGKDKTLSVLRGSHTVDAPTTYKYKRALVTLIEPELTEFPTTGGTRITMTGTNFGSDASKITVLVGWSGGTCDSVLMLAPPSGTEDRLSCVLPAYQGSPKARMLVDNVNSFPGALIAYESPSITQVTGCTPDGLGTVDCPTSAGPRITLIGSGFGVNIAESQDGAAVQISVNAKPCTDPVMETQDTHISCQLPNGIGLTVPVELVRDTQLSAVNLLSYDGPGFVTGSLRTVSGSPNIETVHGVSRAVHRPGTLTPSGVTLRIDGSGLTDDILVVDVYIGPAEDPQWRACTVTAVDFTYVEFEAPSGVGTNLYVTAVVQGLVSGQSMDMISYPAPELTAGTLRFFGRSPPGDNPSQIFSNTSLGDAVEMDGQHFPSDTSQLTVEFSRNDGIDPWRSCLVLAGFTTPTQISCQTEPSQGLKLVFRVTTGVGSAAMSVVGVDTYSYVTAPIIYSIEGCPGSDGNATTGCPTSGKIDSQQIILTIHGVHFGGAITSILVGDERCEGASAVSGFQDTQVTCRLPAGIGLTRPVVVDRGEVFSAPASLVSYSPPVVYTMFGCPTDTGNTTAGCDRFGGDVFTITGAHFGDSRARVLIGGVDCANLTHDVSDPHSQLVCVLPVGSNLKPVAVVQYTGQVVVASDTIEYAKCDPGSFENELALCEECTEGYFAEAAGQPTCLACDPGSFSLDGASSCTLCGPGTFNNVSAQTSCDLCPQGTFNNGSFRCLPCLQGHYGTRDGQSACNECPAGFFQDELGATVCKACAVGSSNNLEGQLACVACAPGSATAVNATVDCPLCPAGRSFESVTSCVDCAVGKFVLSDGSVECTSCPVGFFNNRTGLSSPCEGCRRGRFANSTGQSACAECARGTFAQSRDTVECIQCNPGRYMPFSAASVCVDCPVGRRQSLSGRSHCEDCALGRYADLPGQVVCSRCDPGRFSNDSGLHDCFDCPPGRFGARGLSGGASICDDCVTGTIGAYWGTQLCSACPVGYYAPSGASACQSCAPGRAAEFVKSPQCDVCAAGRFSGNASSTCRACPAGSYSETDGMSHCRLCPAGSYQGASGQSGCEFCVSGSINPVNGSSECRQCPSGRVAQFGGMTGCVDCDLGKFSLQSSGSGADRCTECPAGTFGFLTGQPGCVQCPGGTYTALTGQTSCLPCERGKYRAEIGSEFCQDCPQGRAQNFTAQLECIPCEVGTFTSVTGQNLCGACPQGKHAPEPEMSECQECQPGRYNPKPRQKSCLACPQGMYQPSPFQTTCVDCPAGRFQRSGNQSHCDDCNPGFFAPASSSSCIPCAAGSFAANYSQPECGPCPGGYFSSQSGAAECLACEPGKVSQEQYAVCVDCGPGRFAGGYGMTGCALCKHGKFQPFAGQAACTNCSLGKHGPTEQLQECDPCAPGRYGPSTGQQSCIACPAGKSQHQSSSQFCVDCAPGTISADAAPNCTMCVPGKYQPDHGRTVCLECSKGRFQGTPGQPECTDCAVGFFGNQDGLSSCSDCPLGKYQNDSSTSYCYNCPLGRYGPLPGRLSSCPFCGPGRFASLTGQSSCFTCAKGYYQPASGAVSCEPCPPRHFQDEIDSTACYLCPVGRASSRGAEVQCGACPQGNFAPENGTDACTPCPEGKYQGIEGQSYCSLCSAGRFSNPQGQVFGAVACTSCEPFKIAPFLNHTACLQCGPNSIANIYKNVCLCNPNFYEDSRLPSDTPADVHCKTCPTGADCSGFGVTFDSLPTRSGFWRSSTSSLEYYSCIVADYCQGGVNSACKGARTGPLCQLCKDGYLETPDRRCSACADSGGLRWVAFGFLFLLMMVALIAVMVVVVKLDNHLLEAGIMMLGAREVMNGDTDAASTEAAHGSPTTEEPDTPASPSGQNPDEWKDEVEGEASDFSDGDAQTEQSVAAVDSDGGSAAHDSQTGGHSDSSAFSSDMERGGRGAGLGGSGDDSDLFDDDSPPAAPPAPPVVSADDQKDDYDDAYSDEYDTFEDLDGCDDNLLVTEGDFDDPARQRAEWEKIRRRMLNTRNCGMGDMMPHMSRANPLRGLDGRFAGMHSLGAMGGRGVGMAQHPDGARLLFTTGGEGEEDEEVNTSDEDADIRKSRGDVLRPTTGVDRATEKRVRQQLLADIHEKTRINSQLKILVAFFQILTTLAFLLEAPWPTAYREMVRFFEWVNLDLLQFSQAGCVAKVDFFSTYLTVVCLPLVILVAVWLFYYVPSNVLIRLRSPSVMQRHLRLRVLWAKLIKLILFSTFIVYPRLSAVTFRMYNCTKVEGVWYLTVDFSIVCFEGRWNDYAIVNAFFVLLYPIGIPLMFLLLLYRNKANFQDPITRYQMGFLFEPYVPSVWWFEAIDQVHKLLMTSFLVFLPHAAQLPTGMSVSVLYFLVLLLRQPYLRDTDERLHLLAQVELFLFVFAGWIFSSGNYLDTAGDLVMSLFLIAGAIFFVGMFLVQIRAKIILMALRVFTWCRERRERKQAEEAARLKEEARLAALAEKGRTNRGYSLAVTGRTSNAGAAQVSGPLGLLFNAPSGPAARKGGPTRESKAIAAALNREASEVSRSEESASEMSASGSQRGSQSLSYTPLSHSRSLDSYNYDLSRSSRYREPSVASDVEFSQEDGQPEVGEALEMDAMAGLGRRATAFRRSRAASHRPSMAVMRRAVEDSSEEQSFASDGSSREQIERSDLEEEPEASVSAGSDAHDPSGKVTHPPPPPSENAPEEEIGDQEPSTQDLSASDSQSPPPPPESDPPSVEDQWLGEDPAMHEDSDGETGGMFSGGLVDLGRRASNVGGQLRVFGNAATVWSESEQWDLTSSSEGQQEQQQEPPAGVPVDEEDSPPPPPPVEESVVESVASSGSDSSEYQDEEFIFADETQNGVTTPADETRALDTAATDDGSSGGGSGGPTEHATAAEDTTIPQDTSPAGTGTPAEGSQVEESADSSTEYQDEEFVFAEEEQQPAATTGPTLHPLPAEESAADVSSSTEYQDEEFIFQEEAEGQNTQAPEEPAPAVIHQAADSAQGGPSRDDTAADVYEDTEDSSSEYQDEQFIFQEDAEA